MFQSWSCVPSSHESFVLDSSSYGLSVLDSCTGIMWNITFTYSRLDLVKENRLSVTAKMTRMKVIVYHRHEGVYTTFFIESENETELNHVLQALAHSLRRYDYYITTVQC